MVEWLLVKGKKPSLRSFSDASSRRLSLENQLKIKLNSISTHSFTEDQVVGRNIENLVGATHVPLGIAGPVLIANSQKRIANSYYIPLATTEGALVASISRGCKAINESGGAAVYVEDIGITRGPVFKSSGLSHSQKAVAWIAKNFNRLAKAAENTSSHLKLKKIEPSFLGRHLWLRFYFETQDAMGMNMATIASEKIVQVIEKETKLRCVSVAGNFDIDKKAAWLNFIQGRGKRIWAEVTIPKRVVKNVLKTNPLDFCEVVNSKVLLGSAISGSLGFNAHFANVIAALFLATGQDLAHVVEGSLGVTTAEIDDGDLYVAIFLPSVVTGIVGGGTKLPTQQEALLLMGVKGTGDVIKYLQVLGAAVLAGEISLLASQAEGSLASAHQKLGRK